MNYGSFWERWVRGVSWTWVNERYRGRLPKDFDATIMTLQSGDRLHTKQGRSTARVVWHSGAVAQNFPAPPVSVYLKRHYRLPWVSRLAATFIPSRTHSPAAAEWSHLERARALGVEVPDVVAAGEEIGPHAGLRSFLMVAELTGCEAINEVLPKLAARLDRRDFAVLKRRIITEIARITATLHAAHYFHKDLYLCHFFLDLDRLRREGRPSRIVLIDMHRLGAHRILRDWWRWKDLGQLLFSTFGVTGIDDRDRLRFWCSYKRRTSIPLARWQERLVRFRAARYARHNRK
ncbi:MAG: lipopolysaccharide kinase InaA family protein [Isosphaeraceae bacterium]